MKLFYTLIFILCIQSVFTQEQIYQTGFSNQERQEVILSIQKLEPLFQRDPTKEMALQLADGFFYIKKYKKAISYYEYAIDISPLNEKQTENYFSALFEFGDISMAKTVSKEFLVRFGKKTLIEKLENFEKLSIAKPVQIENYVSFNSKSNEYGLYPLFADYRIVNSDRALAGSDIETRNRFMNPYVVSTNSAKAESPRQFGILDNDKFLYTITHYDPIDKKVYITRNTSIRFNLNQIINPTSTMKIYTATMDAFFRLGELTPFQFNSDTYSVGHACVSQDGQMLYFVSDMPGGYGGTDIYRCLKLEDGTWGAPINIGNEVNSKGDEMFPYISPKGNELYFSSTGHSVFGGLDINKSYKSRANVFSKPTNLGSPINSNKNDFAIIFTDERNGDEGYFSSGRVEGLGGTDIYKFAYENKEKKKPKKQEPTVNNTYNGKQLTVIRSYNEEPEGESKQQDGSLDFRSANKKDSNLNKTNSETSTSNDELNFNH